MHNNSTTQETQVIQDADSGLASYMSKVYREMAIAIGTTALVSYVFGQDLRAISAEGATFLPEGMISAIYGTPLIWLIMFSPLIMIFFMGKMMRSASPKSTRMFLYTFASLMGISLATIFLQYADILIAQALMATTGAFAALSLWGYTTRRDLSAWGSFLLMGAVGIIIAMIINIFMASSALQFAISAVAIAVFAGFTAYDTQTAKTEYLHHRGSMSDDEMSKTATFTALTLYMDFLIMFQHILSIFGIVTDD